MKKTFAIGDIHGACDLLIKMIDSLPINWDEDRIVFMGDYIDRGKKIKETIEYLETLKGDIIFLRGNHEDMFLKYMAGIDPSLYVHPQNGGDTTLKQVEDLEWLERFVRKTHMWFEDDKYFYVHGGLFAMSIEDNKKYSEDLLWVRNEFIYSSHNWGKKVIFGHTILDEPLIEDNKIGIDTGAYYTGKLTCVELPSEKIYQVKI